jgi:peptidoglycan hydrolase-like protein with peptidoglycan-binding domain/chitodextrinase
VLYFLYMSKRYFISGGLGVLALCLGLFVFIFGRNLGPLAHAHADGCTVTITSPGPGNPVLSGPQTFSATVSGCSTNTKVEWLLNGMHPQGEGTWAYDTSPVVGDGTTNYTYNVSYGWDGEYYLTASAEDANGNVLGTSPAVPYQVNDRNIGTISFTAPSSTNGVYTCNNCGTIKLTVTPHITPTPPYNNGYYELELDGKVLPTDQYQDGFPPLSYNLNTTGLENGLHVVWVTITAGINPGDGNSLGHKPFMGAYLELNVNNGSAPRELRLNYSSCYLWLDGTDTCTLSARTENDDNSETPTLATFTTSNPSVATIGNCTNVSSCVVTGVGSADGLATITATAGSGLTAATRIVAEDRPAIMPQFGYNGTLLTSYSSSLSIFSMSMFDPHYLLMSGTHPAAGKAAGLNGLEMSIFTPPSLHMGSGNTIPTLSYMELLEQGLAIKPITAALSQGGFNSFVGNCSGFFQDSDQMQSDQDSTLFSPIMSYLASYLDQKMTYCIQGDEVVLPFTPHGASVIGSAYGPTSVTVSSGIANVDWPGFAGTAYPIDVVSSTNACLNAQDVPLTSVGNNHFTYSASGCQNGTYAPSGGTFTETGFQMLTLNEICSPTSDCTNNNPWDLTVPNSVPEQLENQFASDFSIPVPIDAPLQGSAPAALYQEEATNFPVGDVYWDLGSPNSDYRGFEDAAGVLSTLDSMENQFWTNAWPGMNHTTPFVFLVQVGGSWFVRGGMPFTLASTSGNSFTTVGSNNSAVGAKIRVVGSTNCDGTYDIATAGTTFTVTQSPNCTGSGGTVYIASANSYYTPPMDMLQDDGQDRGIDIAAQLWDSIAMGAGGVRDYQYYYGPQTTEYPDPPLNLYFQSNPNVKNDDQYPALQNTQDGQGGVSDVDDNPAEPEKWNALTLNDNLINSLSPWVLQPSADAPDLGSRVHTGAKCGSMGCLVIAISDSEMSSTINFSAPVFSQYNTGAGPITRTRIINGITSVATTLPANTVSDSIDATPGETVLWQFPAAAGTQTAPPSVPTGLISTGSTTSTISLSWTASADNIGVTGYDVFRNGVQVGTPVSTAFTDTGLTASTTYTYTVAAYDGGGNTSSQSSGLRASTFAPSTPTSTPDTTPPTASITSPLASSTISGAASTVTVSASDNVGVTKVQLYVDGTLAGTDTASPYTFSLNTAAFANGPHTLSAKAYDAADNIGTSPSVPVTITNVSTSTSTTPSFGIKSVSVSGITEGSADLTVTLTSSSSITLRYGLTTAYGQTIPASPYLTTVFENLTGLAPGTIYDFAVSALPQGSTTPVTSQNYSFTTLSTPPPAPVTGGGGSSGGGGGGGGGSVAIPPIGPATTTTIATSSASTMPPSVAISVPPVFPRNLTYGDTGADVALLQRTLKNLGFFNATTTINDTFGQFTQHAVLLFQSAHDLTQSGSLDPETQALLEKVVDANPSIAGLTPAAVASLPPAASASSVGTIGSFPRDLAIGDTGSDVSALQEFLIANGFLHASPTGYFGVLTQSAVAAWQSIRGLPSTGFFGSLSRAAITNTTSTTPIAPTTPQGATTTPTTATPPSSFTENLGPGSSGAEVTLLQKTLFQDGDYPQDLLTGYYGSLTVQAVKAFQAKYGIIDYGSPDTTGYGAVGPKTRRELEGE